ncbi:MAG: hypothetical protein NWR73_11370 [Flavobacteriales bacterium]|jgi:outer membrane biosynthesis protein TonB|nr:hypothetical protein [Flavobacteriales bacterium]
MKTKLHHILLIVGTLFISSNVLAGNDILDDVKKAINRHVIFPVQNQTTSEGTVEVSFKIDDSGKVRVLSIESTSPDLMQYVLTKLEKIQLDSLEKNDGQTIRYRFVFKPQA